MNMVIHEGFQIKPSKQNPRSFIVVTDGRGGKIPSVLEGLFTHVSVATTTIDNYLLNKREANGKKSNKEISTG